MRNHISECKRLHLSILVCTFVDVNLKTSAFMDIIINIYEDKNLHLNI